MFVRMLHLSTDFPFRLIVIDNGSTDGTRDHILELEKQGTVHDHLFTDENLPLAAAFTEGFKQKVTSGLFITVADDMIPAFTEHDWLEIFVNKMKIDGSVGSINFVAARCNFHSFIRKKLPSLI